METWHHPSLRLSSALKAFLLARPYHHRCGEGTHPGFLITLFALSRLSSLPMDVPPDRSLEFVPWPWANRGFFCSLRYN